MKIEDIHHIEIFTNTGQIISLDMEKILPVIQMIQKSSFLSSLVESLWKQ